MPIQPQKLSIENIVNHLGGGIFCCKNDDVLTVYYASKSFYDMIGYKENEITAFCGNEANYVISREQHINWKKLSIILKKRGFVELELKLIKKNGHHIWTSCFLRLMTMKDGSNYFCGILEDITKKRRCLKMERKQLETIKRAKNVIELLWSRLLTQFLIIISKRRNFIVHPRLKNASEVKAVLMDCLTNFIIPMSFIMMTEAAL